MSRCNALLFLLLLCAAGPTQADGDPATSTELVLVPAMYAAIGAAHPPQSGKLLMAFGLLPDDNDRDPTQFRLVTTLMFLAAGSYDNLAGQRKANRGSVFLANLAILGPGFYLACDTPDSTCGYHAPAKQGLYIAPLPQERGMLLGYHLSF